MKKLIVIIFALSFFKIGYSQQVSSDSIISLFQQAIRRNPIQFVDDYKETFSKLDSNIQANVLNYLYTYSQDPLLYLNINKLHQILGIYYVSNCTRIRQKATNLLLETYRLQQGTKSTGWVWYENAKLSDFDDVAKDKIMSIIKCEPLSRIELELLYKYELKLMQNSYYNDTLRVREYRKKTKLTLKELRDSVAMVVAMDNLKNINPSVYVEDLNIFYLSAWLYMYETIPYIEKAMNASHTGSKQYFKLPLARLGNKDYEMEFFDSMNKTNNFDYRILGFIRDTISLNEIINSLKLKGRPKGKISARNKDGKWVEVEIEGDLYNCSYLRQLIYQNLIPDLPFKFDGLSLAMCEIPEEDINNVIAWLEKNQKTIVLNPDFH